MPNRRSHDHIGNRNFKVEIEGVTQGAFAQCSGVEVEVEVVEFHDGDDLNERKRPGQTRYANIVLKRGYTNTEELWNWMKAVIDGKVERKAGSIILQADDGSEISRYNFFEGWPCRWKGYEFDAGGTGASVEELEITVERIERG